MEKKLMGFAGNFLLSLNIFILVLVVFENRLVIPVWLQPIGRLHPMILHFPLVLLIVAMSLEFFRFGKRDKSGEFADRFTTNLLVAGTILAAITVIMGIFLSREDGYEGPVLRWHKWSGLGVLFFASLVCLFRTARWYKKPAARISSLLILLLLILTGHYGAVLTHGQDFITAPLMKNRMEEPIALEQAVSFEHVIAPIFQTKCISCHNSSKVKGGLLLTDSAAIVRGGKSGKLMVPGNPALSLLIQRLHLPESDEKHMPPAGKPQLTKEEIELLGLWIAMETPFTKRIVEYPENDSFRILASTRFSSSARAMEFDFAAADAGLIRQLNNDYRVIKPVAAGSPALNVNIYHKETFSNKVLEELKPITEQIVSLNLTGMPVQDEQLKLVAGFKNLRSLNLNFTAISGSGLKYLEQLKTLNSLSLSGTAVRLPHLQMIGSLDQLNRLALWNTSITDAEIEALRKANKGLLINSGVSDDGSVLQLNLPQVLNEATVFSQPMPLQLSHPVKGVQLRYTTDGSRPDSIQSNLYEDNKVLVTENSSFRVRAFKEGWLGSEEAIFSFYKSRYKPDSSGLLTTPHEPRKAHGIVTLFDNVLGNPSNYYHASWIGFSGNNLELILKFNEAARISSVGFNVFQVPGAGSFPPTEMEIWSAETPGKFKLVNTIKFDSFNEKTKEVLFIEHRFPAVLFKYMKIVIKPLMFLPPKSSLSKKGLSPILLIDEILLN